MTVWIITDRGNEVVGVFDTESNALSSINYSYHKLPVKIEKSPTLHRVNDWQVSILGPSIDDHFRVYEEMVHSSRTHL